VYGLSRSLLAFGTFATLLFHDVDSLFRPLGVESIQMMGEDIILQWALFSFFNGDLLWLGKWLALAGLALVMSGWRPRFTGILHWWIAVSFAGSSFVANGGDQVAAVLTLLLIPITLTDGRRWHWSRPPASNAEEGAEDAFRPALRSAVAGLVAMSAYLVIRLQVCFIYFEAATAKLSVAEWSNGTAVYYWFLHPIFGVPEWLEGVILTVLSHAPVVVAATWGAIVLEAVLAMGLFMKNKYRGWLLVAGILFHAAIAVIHGLFSFFFAMAPALILYLRPLDQPFPLQQLARSVQSWVGDILAMYTKQSKTTSAPVQAPLHAE